MGEATGDEEDSTVVESLPEPPTAKSSPPTVLSSAGAGGSSAEIVDRELSSGTQVGEYRVEGKIGEGAMGVVYTAVHPVINKRVAVKVLKQALCDDRGAIERFIDEARVVNEIGSPNIVDVFAFGTLPDGRYYLVMEWLRGESLRDRLATGSLALDEACDITLALSRALDAAHTKGVIHRDVKPENVFLIEVPDDAPRVKLLDFGIAKLANDDHRVERTLAGAMVGTPQYVAPEQARGLAIDHRADTYSLGVVLYELITGKPPFVADNAAEMIAKHLTEPAPEPSILRDDTPDQLDELVTAMLTKHPSGRPSLTHVQQVLKRVRGELATTPMRPLRVRDLRFSAAVTTPMPAMIEALTATRDEPPAAAAPPIEEPVAKPVDQTADEPAEVDESVRESRWSTLRRDPARAERRRTMWILLAALAIAAGALVVRFVALPEASEPEANAPIAPLTVTPIRGHVHIELDGALTGEFAIDQEVKGTAHELDAELEPGQHQIEIRSDGFIPVLLSINVAAGESVRRTVAMQRLGSD
ncbi:MAG TPA: serine/threonine-protein kinase [Kofleriaceae bacterium]